MKLFIASFLILLSHISFAQQSLEHQIFELPDVIFEKIEDKPDGYEALYQLKIRQPLDHQDHSKGFFYQKVFLSHKGFDRPTVIVTEGYTRTKNRIYELSQQLEANQIDVEHRFFGESMPKELDYQYLSFNQAAADLHHINQLFKKIYKGKWVSTGISKGGQTTIYYRYFYPDDVDVSVPYVAPHNVEFEEKRIYEFLDTIGTDECRAAILNVQKKVLKNREESLKLLRWFAKGAKLEFNYLSFEEAFEFAVLEYPFSFWQWGANCEDIPPTDAPLEETLAHMIEVSGIGFFSDRDMEFFASHYYQAANQMGYYGYETEDFEGLLKALPMQPHPHAAFTPNKMEVKYEGELSLKVADWLGTSANQFVYINGANDTWSATAVPPNKKTDALWFFLAGKDHGQARIKNMTDKEKQRLENKLEEWLEMELEIE